MNKKTKKNKKEIEKLAEGLARIFVLQIEKKKESKIPKNKKDIKSG